MFFPFIGAASVAIAFAQLGALSTKVAVLTGSLYAVILIAIVLALYALPMTRKAKPFHFS
jgi:energy-converting hydrogenase Eha subunit A